MPQALRAPLAPSPPARRPKLAALRQSAVFSRRVLTRSAAAEGGLFNRKPDHYDNNSFEITTRCTSFVPS